MSRIGNKPVPVPAGVAVQVEGNRIAARGPKGELTLALPPGVTAEVREGAVRVGCTDTTDRAGSYHGLGRSLVANLVAGVSRGFSRELELQGVGFRASVQGGKLVLAVGYSVPVEYLPPRGVTVEVKENVITVRGADKQAVGDAAARIRAFYPPEPYKGKGIRYRGEYVRRKAGKTVA
jgi:large subunit ribosomal protein L6